LADFCNVRNLSQQSPEAGQAQATRQYARSPKRTSVPSCAEHRSVAIDVGHADDQVRAQDERFQRIRAAASHISAMELERVPLARGSSSVALLASFHSAHDSDVH